MFTSYLDIHTILVLFFIYMTRETICQTTIKISTEKIIERNENLPQKTSDDKNFNCIGPRCLKYWMSQMGFMEEDLTNVQAIIVKDREAKGLCDPAKRKSNKRFMMCAGSILNRNHVLTSASCLHQATHIKHNVRGALAVVIAPLKSSIQVIKVADYKINPAHDTNPYSPNHLKHNMAIIKLACRIDMENFHKIDLPQTPFMHLCTEENCIVAVYRKVRSINWVMYQILAPHGSLPNRRRKETMIKDGELRKSLEYKMPIIRNDENHRLKRKLAEPPLFISRYESRENSKMDDDGLMNLTKNGIIENSPIEQTTIIFGDLKNSNHTISSSLQNMQYEDWMKFVGNERIKSLVVRSTDGHHSCAQTGAPIMINRTQVALVSTSCDDRQPLTKWGYTDLFDNLDWIHKILQDWNSNTNSSTPGSETGNGQGNFSSCSTCIFNFFIEIGCKGKNDCGKKNLINSRRKHAMFGPDKFFNSMEPTKPNGCSDSNSVGIEIGIGQGCEKGNEKNEKKRRYRGNLVKSINQRTIGFVKQKIISSSNERFDDISKHEITRDPMKKIIVKDQRDDGDKYMKKNNPLFISPDQRKNFQLPSSMTRIYETSKNENKNHERASNEIRGQNNDVMIRLIGYERSRERIGN